MIGAGAQTARAATGMIVRTDLLKLAGRLRYTTQLAAVAIAYLGAAKLGLLAAVAQEVVSSAWPPSGVALATLLLLGLRYWPGIAVGALRSTLAQCAWLRLAIVRTVALYR